MAAGTWSVALESDMRCHGGLFLREDDRCEEGGEGMRTSKNEDKLLRKNQNHSMFLNEHEKRSASR